MESTVNTSKPYKFQFINSFWLHIIAFAFMLCDHMWATIIPGQPWMTYLGRIAFPVFAFMIVEGLHYTTNRKKYILRLLIAALISEIPFNLMYEGTVFYPYHQNVLFTYLTAIGVILLFELVFEKNKIAGVIVGIVVGFISYFLGYIVGLDFYGEGLLMVYVFYIFRGNEWWKKVAQFVCLFYINWILFKGMYFEIEVLGKTLEIMQQGFAVLALIPIFLYNGQKGYSSKIQKIAFYSFYPAHMLILSLIALYIM